MGKKTSVAAFLLFLLLQLTQGVVLDYLLRQAENTTAIWFWLLADVVLLVFWLSYLLARGTQLVSYDMPFVPIPTISVAWTVYLCVVLVPRLAWVMDEERYCLGFNNHSQTGFETVISGGILNDVTWGPNTLVTVLAVGSTSMLVCLVIAGYSQHGIVSSRQALDFDMAEAAFSLIDGVEFLQTFFEVGQSDCGARSSTHNTSVEVTGAQNLTANERFMDNLNGTLGNCVIAISIACFVLPTFALWLLKRRSNELKASEKIDKDKRQIVQDATANAGVDAADALKAQSSTNIDMMMMEGNIQTIDTFQKEISVIRAIYVFWDVLCINLPGAVLRFVFWFVYGRPISALITKNVLSVLFRTFHIFNDYIRPCCAPSEVVVPGPNGAGNAPIGNKTPSVPVSIDNIDGVSEDAI